MFTYDDPVSEGQQLQTGETFLEIASLYHPPDCKQLLDEVFVISRIIKVEVGIISRRGW